MRFLALACDYDGTLAERGRIAPPTQEALVRARASGRVLLLVTGRELDDVLGLLPEPELFRWIIAENGAVLYETASRSARLLASPPPADFVGALRCRGVSPLSVGRAILATHQPHDVTVLAAIREFGLDLHVIYNKGAVMVLPADVTKATGLALALKALDFSPHNVIGIGDGENDHALLRLCECSVAVANALPQLQERADYTTAHPAGQGVIELIEMLRADDLAQLEPRLTRHHVLIGETLDGQPMHMPPYGRNVLVAGSSGGGKSTLVTGLVERLVERGYQCCILDPEGDYETFAGVLSLGTNQRPPSVDEVIRALENPDQHVAVNLISLPLNDRPAFFTQLMPQLQALRARTGRPHWLIIDEAHHVLPAPWDRAPQTLPQQLISTLLVTIYPHEVAPAALAGVDTVIVVGQGLREILASFRRAIGPQAPPEPNVPGSMPKGEALVWRCRQGEPPVRVRVVPTHTQRRRHRRKYAEGDLGDERSFYFRGPEGALNLRAQNLLFFLQLAEGLDPETWLYHLHRKDYSRWFREAIKDSRLAEETSAVEDAPGLSPEASLGRIREAIERRYTRPEASPALGSAPHTRGPDEPSPPPPPAKASPRGAAGRRRHTEPAGGRRVEPR